MTVIENGRVLLNCKMERQSIPRGPRSPEPHAFGTSTQQMRDRRGRVGRKPLPEPIPDVMDQTLGIHSSVRARQDTVASQRAPQNKAGGLAAGKQFAPPSLDHATGVIAPPGIRKFGAERHDPARRKPEDGVAGIDSIGLSNARGVPKQADTGTSKKKHTQLANASILDAQTGVCRSVDARYGSQGGKVVPGDDLRGEVVKHAAGINSSFSSVVGKGPTPELLKGRKTTFDPSRMDPKHGIAGTPSSATQASFDDPNVVGPSFDEIPHSNFQPTCKKQVPGPADSGNPLSQDGFLGIKEKQADPRDVNFTKTNPLYLGAAGESSKHYAHRMKEETEKVKLRSGNTEVDSLVFGHDTDNSAADDWYEEQLYSGAGNRSNSAYNPYDMSTRRSDHLTGDQIYGYNAIAGGTDLDGEREVVDPRDFSDHAGSSSKYLAEKLLSSFDITQRMATVGSSAVNPTEADSVIFGMNLDMSGADTRDFEGAAGAGPAAHNLSLRGDISTVPTLRPPPDANSNQPQGRRDMNFNPVAEPAPPKRQTLPDKRTEGGATAGKNQPMRLSDSGDCVTRQTSSVASTPGLVRSRGDTKRAMATQEPFDVLRGSRSQAVTDIERNPVFDGSAGVTAHRLNVRAEHVEPHNNSAYQKRPQAIDLVPDPFERPLPAELTPAEKAEYAKLYGSMVDTVVFGVDTDGSGANDYVDPKIAEKAGMTSEWLAKKNPDLVVDTGVTKREVLERTPDWMLKGSAGQAGSPDMYLAKSRKGGFESSARMQEKEKAFQVIVQDRTVKPSPPDWGTNIDRQQKQYGGFVGKASGEYLKHSLDQRIHGPPEKQRRGKVNREQLGEVDEVVFGHNTDGSLQEDEAAAELIVPGSPAAGVGSKALQNRQMWERHETGKKTLGPGSNCGVVDEVVFGTDLDGSTTSGGPGSLLQEPEYWGSKGCNTEFLGTQSMLNVASARMHMPIELHSRTGQSNDKDLSSTLDTLVFGRDIDGSSMMELPKSKADFAGSAGGVSGNINDRNAKLKSRRASQFYNAQKAVVDEILFGTDLDPDAMTQEDLDHFNMGSAGRSSVHLNVASEAHAHTGVRKKCVPSRAGQVAEVLQPEEGHRSLIKEHSRKTLSNFEVMHRQGQPAGLSAAEVALSGNREMFHLDGGARKTRSSRKVGPKGPSAGLDNTGRGTFGEAAPGERGVLPSGHRSRRGDPTRSLTDSYGKPSGVGGRLHNDGSAVAEVLCGEATQLDAYSRALGAGRAMLATPYTSSPVRPSTAGDESQGRQAAAGGFTKEEERKLEVKARPQQLSAHSPFGLDDLEATKQARFVTTASNIGSNIDNNIGSWTKSDQRPRTAPQTRPTPKSTALVSVAAGARTRLGAHPEAYHRLL